MDPSDRRKRAAQLAEEINTDPLLQDDLKFLLTDHTMTRMSTQDSLVMNFRTTPIPQFDER